MNIVKKIEKILKTSLLSKGLCYIPAHGASPEAISEEEKILNRSLSETHKEFLSHWDGINLEVVRLFGCKEDKETRKLSKNQFELPEKGNPIFFASEPTGFIYAYDKQENVYSIDTDGWEITKTADSLDEFICDFVFGKRAAEFAGDDWYEEVKAHGLIEDKPS